MRNAAKYGNAMRSAIKMDGEGPPAERTLSYGRSNAERYQSAAAFMDAIERLGAKGAVAEAHANSSAHEVTHITGERIVIDPKNRAIVYIEREGV